MKKIFISIMCLLLAASFSAFAACKNNGNKNDAENPPDDNPPIVNPGDGDDEPVKSKIEIISPQGTVVPYSDAIKSYLSAGKGADVSDFAVREYNVPVKIEWKYDGEEAEGFKVEYSRKSDYSEAVVCETGAEERSVAVYNLYKDARYYLRVSARKADGGAAEITETTFDTTDKGPRVLKINGIHNVRDLGGYKTSSGKTTVQGRFYRGGALSKCTDSAYDFVKLKEDGAAYMQNVLKIKTDVDLRSKNENLGLTESPIPGASLEYYGVNGYMSAYTEKAAYSNLFKALSDESRYPVYMHCTGGADRTGTVACIVNALCGVSETELIQDYEITSFTVYGERSYNSSVYSFKQFFEKLKTFSGETLADKAESYLLSIGVTETEIFNIKAIMFGEPTKIVEQPEPAEQPEKIQALSFNGQKVTLNTASTIAHGETVIGYDGKIAELNIDEILDDGAGDTYFFVGSYGVRFRGGLFRLAKRNGDVFSEISPRVNAGEKDRLVVNAGVKFGISVTLKDSEKAVITLYIDDVKLVETEIMRVSDEILSDSATFLVAINTGHVTKAVFSAA